MHPAELNSPNLRNKVAHRLSGAIRAGGREAGQEGGDQRWAGAAGAAR